jgi:hypothetical protein
VEEEEEEEEDKEEEELEELEEEEEVEEELGLQATRAIPIALSLLPGRVVEEEPVDEQEADAAAEAHEDVLEAEAVVDPLSKPSDWLEENGKMCPQGHTGALGVSTAPYIE